MPFRQWLASINPDEDDIDEQQEKWWQTSKKIIRSRGAKLARNVGQQAIVGKRGNNVPNAYNWFLWRTKNTENLAFRREKGGKG
jgi:hypothetical protein